MASVIFEESLQDQGFIDKHVRFSDGDRDVDQAAFRQFLQAYAPEKVEQELGVSATDIRRVAYLFARSPATMSLWTMGMNQRTQGVFLNSMLNGLHLMTGQIGRPGATPFSLTGQPNACGGVRDTGALSHALPGRTAGGESRSPPRDGTDLGRPRGNHLRQAGVRCHQPVPGDGGRAGQGGARHVHESRRVAPGRRALPGRDGEMFHRRGRRRRGQRDAAARASACCRRRCGSRRKA